MNLGNNVLYMNHLTYELMTGPMNELPQCKVVQDLDKFMGSLSTKMSSVYDMKEVLESPENPPPLQRFQLCPVAMTDWWFDSAL